jgi:hypothetical protein
MFVTTLLSCRLLEPIAIARLQASRIFHLEGVTGLWKQSPL